MEISNAIASAYCLGTADKISDVGCDLRNNIIKSYSSKPKLEWPPRQEYLKTNNDLPSEFRRFLCTLLFGKCDNLSEKENRHLLSLGQDLCRVVTNYN